MAVLLNAVDYSRSRPEPVCLYKAGKRAVMRYVWTSYKPTDAAYPGKLLLKSEADQLRSAGLDIVSNFESWTGRARDGYAAGAEDAVVAVKNTLAAGGPPGAVVYFSVDEDTTGDKVAAYFKGVASVIGLARSGAYGSYRVVKYLFDNKLITYGWQTYAWSGGQWDSRAHIRQVKNGVQLCGGDLDLDEIHRTPYGAWSEGDDMALAKTDVEVIAATDGYFDAPTVDPDGNPLTPEQVAAQPGGKTWMLKSHIREQTERARVQGAAIKALQAKIDAISTGGVDMDALAAKVADLLAQRLQS